MTYTPEKATRDDEIRRDGRRQSRKTIQDDKLVGVSSLAAGSVGISSLKSENAVITISETNTSGTATVTSGNIILGFYISNFTAPAASYVKLSISLTTLTATLSTAPGTGKSVEITVVMLKL